MKLSIFEEIKPSDVLRSSEACAAFLRAVEGYLSAGAYEGKRPLDYEEGKKVLTAKLQAVMGTSVPRELAQPTEPKVVRINDILPETDTRYLQIYNVVESDSEAELYEKVESGMAFKQIKPGEEIPITQRVKGERVTLPNVTWAGAIRFPREWFEDNKVYKITQALQDAKTSIMDKKASFLYGLLKAQKYPTSPLDTSSPDKIVESLNKAYLTLRRKLGKDIVSASRIKLLCSPEFAVMINEIKQNALAVTKKFAFNFDIIDTVHFADTDAPELVVAKADQYLQQRTPLRVDQTLDVTTLEVRLTFSERFNAIILSTNYGVKLA